jgi:hypothetical protein
MRNNARKPSSETPQGFARIALAQLDDPLPADIICADPSHWLAIRQMPP